MGLAHPCKGCMANGRGIVIDKGEDYSEELKAVGSGDGFLSDIAHVALILGALDRPGVSFQKYEHHLKILILDIEREAIGDDTAHDRARALSSVLHDCHDYTGNVKYYEDLQNANLMSVIDTRLGIPVSLSILYIHVARSQGWQVEGLEFPYHFLIRLKGPRESNEQVIIDPFNGGKILDARDLRNLIKENSDMGAELKPEYYEAITDREILVRLLNNIKIRCLKVSDLGQAIKILERLVMIDPDQAQHHYELGMLLAHVKQTDLAFKYLSHCLDHMDQFKQNDLVEQQVINTLKDLEKQRLEDEALKGKGSNIFKLPETE